MSLRTAAIATAAALVSAACGSITVTEPQVPPRAWGSAGGMSGTQPSYHSYGTQSRSPASSIHVAPGDYAAGAGRGAFMGLGACAQAVKAGPLGAGVALLCAPFGVVIGALAGAATAVPQQ